MYKSLPTRKLVDGDTLKIDLIKTDIILCVTRESYQRRKDIEAYIKDIKAESLINPPELDQLVLSPYEGDGALYRGVVKNVTEKTADIYFIDYGNSETVPIKQLKNVDERLAAWEPALVHSPKYWYLDGRTLSDEQSSYFEINASRKYRVTLTKCTGKCFSFDVF